MSAFLGPIHFWLYNKIQFQESLIDELIRYAADQGWSDGDLADKYGSKDRRKLDEVVDESNIHGWLQLRIHDAGGRYAALVLDVAGNQEDRLTALKKAAYDFGTSQHLSAATAPEAFHRLDDLLLDGMPCDQVTASAKAMTIASPGTAPWTCTVNFGRATATATMPCAKP